MVGIIEVQRSLHKEIDHMEQIMAEEMSRSIKKQLDKLYRIFDGSHYSCSQDDFLLTFTNIDDMNPI